MTSESGRVDGDSRIHAVRRLVNGPVSQCGAGKIVAGVPGRFNPADPDACPECSTLAAGS
jgi:hypothetical protein